MKARTIALALTFIGFALRIYHLQSQSLWTDEGFSIDFASQSIHRMLEMWNVSQPIPLAIVVSRVPDAEIASAADTHAPLYYFLLHFLIPLAGRTEFAIRFPSLVFGVLVVPLLYLVGRRLFDERVGLYAALFGAVAPFYVAYSQEARMYTLSLALSLLSVYLMARIISRGYSAVHVVGYAVITSLALYTHYFTALIVVFENLWVYGYLLFRVLRFGGGLQASDDAGHRLSLRRLALHWTVAQASVVLLFAPWLPTLVQQAHYPKNEALSVPPVSEVLYWFWQSLNAVTSATPQKPAVPLLAILGVAGLLVATRWLVDVPSRKGLALLLLYLAIPLGATLVILQSQPMYHPRYVITASAAYYVLMAAAIAGLQRLNSSVSHLACIGLAVFLAAGLNSYYFNPAFAKDDARGVARFLERHAGADDLIVMDGPEPIGYYYRGRAPFVFLPGDRNVVLRELNKLAVGAKDVYHVKWWQSNTDPSGLISFLLSKEGVRTESEQFIGYRVERYRMNEGLRQFTIVSRSGETEVNLDRLFKLVGVDYGVAFSGDNGRRPVQDVPQGGKMWVLLKWKLLRQTPLEYKAFVTLKDSRGHVVGQQDRALRKGQLSTRRWKTGDAFETYHIVSLLPGTPPGEYELEAGLYDAATQGRVAVLNQALVPVGASIKLGKTRVVRHREAGLVSRQDGGVGDEALGISRILRTDLGPIRLVGYDLPNRTYKAGSKLSLTLLWQAVREVKEDLVFRLEAEGIGHKSFSWSARGPSDRSSPTDKWVEGEFVRDWQDFVVPRVQPGEYRLKGHVTEPVSGTEVGVVDFGIVNVKARTPNTTVPENANRVNVQFGDSIELAGFELRPQSARAGEVMELTLYWRALRETDRSYTIFTHLLDGSNRIWAQHDGLPAQGEMPTTGWLTGEVVADKHQLEIKADAPPGIYTLEVGVYDANTNRRLSAQSDLVDLMGDAALIGKVLVQQ